MHDPYDPTSDVRKRIRCMKGMVTYRRNMPHRAPTTPPNSLVTELLGDDTVMGDPLVVKAYQEIMFDETVNSTPNKDIDSL